MSNVSWTKGVVSRQTERTEWLMSLMVAAAEQRPGLPTFTQESHSKQAKGNEASTDAGQWDSAWRFMVGRLSVALQASGASNVALCSKSTIN